MRSSSLGLLALALLTPFSALAQDRVSPPRSGLLDEPKLALQFETGASALLQSQFGSTQPTIGAPFLGLMALTELGPLRFGLRGEGSSLGRAEHTLAGAALAGVGTHLGRWHLDLLGQLGVRHTWDIPSGRPSGQREDGASVTAPTAGGRLGISYVLPTSSSMYSLGFWGFVDRDLGSQTSTLTSTTGSAPSVSSSESITRVGALLSVGMQFDLSPPASSQVASR